MSASQELPKPEEPSNEAKEFAKQLVLRADAITAFAVVQSLSFIYLLARGDCFTVNVLRHLCLPIAGSIIVSGGYWFLVSSCRRGEKRIFNSSRGTTIESLAKKSWWFRYAIILVALVATVGILWRVKHDIESHHFSTDCKDSKTETHPCCAPCSTNHHE
jgi:hypothetical protein